MKTAPDLTEDRRLDDALLAAAVVDSSDDGIMSVDCGGAISSWNAGARRMFGYSPAEVIGQPVTLLFPPEIWDDEVHILARVSKGERIAHYTTYFVSKDGKCIHISLAASPLLKPSGLLVGAALIARDVTAQRLVEAAVRASEERFRVLANSAPVMLWMSGDDKRCTYFNQTWLEFTGRPLDREVGTGWSEGVHPHDLARCLDTYSGAFDRREPFRREYRLRRHDGEYRWILDTGVPRFTAGGAFCGFIGSSLDVTVHKRAEEALSSVSQRLLEAHELERARIATTLHEDIGQRLVALKIQLEGVGQAGWSERDAHGPIDHMCAQLNSLLKDVHTIACRFRSSKLQYLGIAAAAQGFCKEMSQQHDVNIEVRCQGIPGDLRGETALGLFRVLQEAVTNAVTHAAADRVTVLLGSCPEAITLEVRDTGIGFDAHAVRGRGVGIPTMQQRVRLMNGHIVLESAPGGGTTVRVRLPR